MAAVDLSKDISSTGRRLPVHRWVLTMGLTSWFFLGFSAAVAVIAIVFAAAKDITLPLVLAIFLAAVLAPVVDWLAKLGLKRSLASALLVVLSLGLVLGIGVVVVGGLASQGDEMVEAVDGALDELRVWFDDQGLDPEVLESARASVNAYSDELAGGVATRFAGLLDSTMALIAGGVLGVMILYYLLKDGPTIIESMLSGSGRGDSRAARRVLEDSSRSIQAYFRGKTALAAVQGVSIAFVAVLFGVPMALAVGVVNFVGAYIPYFGAFIGGAFAVLMALSVGGFELALLILVVVLVANLALENFLEPVLLSDKMDLHPLLILLTTIIGGLVAGIVGLVLAAPLTAIARTIYRELRAAGFFDDDTSQRDLGTDNTNVGPVQGPES